jgi:hypothetical protein
VTNRAVRQIGHATLERGYCPGALALVALDQTVVPWASLWLFYFEEWLASDVWKGGGIHPELDDEGDSGGAG